MSEKLKRSRQVVDMVHDCADKANNAEGRVFLLPQNELLSNADTMDNCELLQIGHFAVL